LPEYISARLKNQQETDTDKSWDECRELFGNKPHPLIPLQEERDGAVELYQTS
jgi:hypothetical protein